MKNNAVLSLGARGLSSTANGNRASVLGEEEEEEDDDDFKANVDYEKMCLDQLVDGVSVGLELGDDDDALEDDDEVRGEADEVEEEDSESEDLHTHDGTVKSETVTNNGNQMFEMRPTEQPDPFRKGFRIQKKKSMVASSTTSSVKKKPGSKSSKKSDSGNFRSG